MRAFLATLARLTATRKPQNRLKEVGLGLLVGAVLGTGGLLSPEWMLWGVLLYCTSMQGVAMIDNDIFCDFRDFRRLGFREVSLAYRVAYVTHYVARDLYVATGIALVTGSTVLVIGGQPWYAAMLPTAYLASVVLIPSHVYLAFRIAERGKMMYLGGLYVVVLSLAAPLALGWHLPPHATPLLVPLWCGTTLLHIAIIDRVAAHLRGNGVSTYGSRRFFTWLKPLSPHVYKDVLLCHGLVVQQLLLGFALLSILAVSTSPGSMSALILLALCHRNVFLGRKNKEYALYSEDFLFHERKLPADAHTLRRLKLRTLALDVPLKLVIAVIVLAFYGQARLDHLSLMGLILITALVIEAPLPHLANRIGRFTRHTASYMMIFTYTLVVTFDQSPVLMVAQCAVTMIVYGPSLFAAYARPRAHAVCPGAHDDALTSSAPKGRALAAF